MLRKIGPETVELFSQRWIGCWNFPARKNVFCYAILFILLFYWENYFFCSNNYCIWSILPGATTRAAGAAFTLYGVLKTNGMGFVSNSLILRGTVCCPWRSEQRMTTCTHETSASNTGIAVRFWGDMPRRRPQPHHTNHWYAFRQLSRICLTFCSVDQRKRVCRFSPMRMRLRTTHSG